MPIIGIIGITIFCIVVLFLIWLIIREAFTKNDNLSIDNKNQNGNISSKSCYDCIRFTRECNSTGSTPPNCELFYPRTGEGIEKYKELRLKEKRTGQRLRWEHRLVTCHNCGSNKTTITDHNRYECTQCHNLFS
jgi:hypothetical protein